MTRPCLPPLKTIAAPAFRAPPGACDSHAHVFGPFVRYPLALDRSYTPAEHPADAFIAHLDELGLTRGVLVTASASGTDNSVVTDALRKYPTRLRGIVVPAADTSDAELDAWHAAGVRGVRINLYQMGGHAVYRNGVGIEVLEALAPRLAERGWHAQIWIHAPDLVTLAPRLKAVGLPLVIDHMGRMATARGVADAGFQALCALLAEGVAWTKISGADRLQPAGAPYHEVDPFVAALLAANPGQVVWGSDWPHINYFEAAQMPDDGVLFNLLARWLPDAAARERVLVTNPARLYDFGNV
ncbi:Predicted metal-dependent hydrolase, TIM-barrel fold [Cupriavidus sp. YR651]|uniref:amidohydrolase family protein n=1 Tax=Cupriavidus sp. YR651 TaxID=1855315 RepID=UPI00088C21F4|nr:amidohydrolase family protein [Cupriavidus sp. YR651]SDD46848.1 Predicted metal-dependent hydrolase, TIM-barrel fold [Cupriavidus sp. YR651]